MLNNSFTNLFIHIAYFVHSIKLEYLGFYINKGCIFLQVIDFSMILDLFPNTKIYPEMESSVDFIT